MMKSSFKAKTVASVATVLQRSGQFSALLKGTGERFGSVAILLLKTSPEFHHIACGGSQQINIASN